MTSASRAGAWITSHKSLAATIAGATLVGTLVAVSAAVSTGYTAQKIDLDDAAVWVTSNLHQAAGRANPMVGELNSAVRVESGSLSVSQFGQTVVVSELGGGQARLIDTAAADVGETIALPVGDVDIALTAGVAVITSYTTGDVWFTTPGALSAFDASAPPDVTLGAGGDTVVSADGTVFAVSSATGSVFAIDPGAGATAADGAASWPIEVQSDDSLSITAVGETWAVLDRTSGSVITTSGVFPVGGAATDPGSSVDAAGTTGQNTGVDDPAGSAGTGAVAASARSWLQQASTAAPGVLVATGSTLEQVSLADGSVTVLADGRSGTSVRPVRVDGCWYAAWTDGTTWSQCAGDPVSGTLEGAASGDSLTFRTNGGDGVLLSDAVSGRSWDVTRQNAPIDNWDALLPDTSTDNAATDTVTDQPVVADPTQRPPVANDDDLGARPGRSTVLPVLLNDYDPNGDVVVIDSVDVPSGVDWSVERISDDQQLQLTLPANASGEISFGYTVSDGRGGTDAAVVRVTVRSPEENSPPVQSSATSIDVALGGRAEADIRSDWFDPDGDAFYLQTAGTAAPDAVAFTPDGRVTFTDSGQSSGAKEVALTVSDGRASSAGTLSVQSHSPEQVPLTADGFVVLAHVGQEIEVSPLEHVQGGGPELRLSNVPAQEQITLNPDYSGGVVRITAEQAGDRIVDYAVTDGTRTASGVIRVIASLPPDANTKPVTVPHSAFARQGTSVLVDVLAGDFDPAGGVLIVSGVDPVAATSGYRVEVLEQRLIRVTLTAPLDSGSASFGYRVTNGLAESTGSVTVIEMPEPTLRQPPVAVADSASVRVGDVVDIPVLANDVHPDGDALTLAPDLVRGLGPDSGLLFTSGSHLRYLAPGTPGDFTAVYRVDAPDGQWASAEVTISVREADATANAAPVPSLVTARVIAGETVRIPIPLSGIDPDGDSVQFLGLDSVPEKGAVSDTGTDWIDYEAGDYSTGTDTFTYTVVDRLGARASGTIRVGVSPRENGARNPVATPDEVLARPGKTVTVRVLDNDSDPDGSALRVTGVEPVTDGATASVVDDMLRVVLPGAEGRYGFIYTIANERGGTSSAFATVDVRSDAPLARPLVSDTVLGLTDILGKDEVEVDVLKNVFFAEGSPADLWLSVLPAYSDVARVDGGRIRVQVKEQRQVIPFTVAHPDDPNVRSNGFIWVPGSDDALPQLRTGAPKLSVVSGTTLRIDVNDYVVAVGGRDVVISDPNTVRATHADGSPLVSGDDTLVFTSADKYFGPASLSFEVADGTGPDARTATLVLPITVTPRDNQPPVFNGAVLEFEPGQQKVIDLTKLTSTASAAGTLSYQVLDPKPAGFSAVLLGSTLTISVDVGVKKGATGAFAIGVASNGLAGTSGRIDVTVVPSTKPLAAPATDSVIAPRGTTTPVDVLANDSATNPFPQTPLTVVAVRGADAAALPAGVTIVPSADKSVLQVTVAPDAAPADIVVQYQVQDGTGDPERAVWGTVRIAVQDRPGAVTGLAVTGFSDRSIALRFSPGVANNSPITGFDVTARTAAGSSVTTRCVSTSCAVTTPGNGPTNAVTLTVVAVNGQGSSDPATYSVPVWSDLLPSAPGAISLAPLDGALEVRWGAASVGAGGSAVRQYDVTANSQSVATVDATGSECDASGCSTVVRGLANGSSTTITVTARNGAYPALAVWPSSSAAGTPYGAPSASGVSAVANLDSGPGSVTLSWPDFAGNGNAVAGYYAQQLAPGTTSVPGGAQACSVSTPAPGRPTAPQAGGSVVAQQAVSADARTATFTGLTAVDTAYSFVVWGYNAAGCTASSIVTAVAYPSPGQVDASQVSMTMVQSGKTVDVRVDSAPTPAAPSNPRYYVQQLDSADAPVGSPQSFTLGGFPRSLTGGAFGDTYRFTLRACSVWGGVEVCGAASAPISAPEPSITFQFAGDPVYDGTSWRWTSDPSNGGLVPQYYCGPRAVTPSADPAGRTVTPTTCTPSTPAAVGDAWLLVVIGSREYVYLG
ncbi:MAG: tandem-95 repeat protein [Herbiconiux sp.]|uniref:Ig-like domain-containing protein n=1 Tax=Herbiconiux sp. TaxID=1871186 RepID=UPI001220A9B6|nr:Ig-like domain-containing protein [Herbiconiux sp.]TAJ46752.1 MAG: tandem-95 repeat protein [Herbiconiux sp.]